MLRPYALLIYKDAYHCLAASEQGEVKAFELNELFHPRCLAEETFEVPDDFRVDDYVQGQFGLWKQGEQTHHVVIELSPFVSAYAKERSVHPSQRLEERQDGSVRLHLELGQLEQVVGWVLGFGPHAKVIEPPQLREDVLSTVAETLCRYESTD